MRLACRHIPGLFAPVEAVQAINAGLADRLIGHHDERGTYRALAPLSIPPNGVYHPRLSGRTFD